MRGHVPFDAANFNTNRFLVMPKLAVGSSPTNGTDLSPTVGVAQPEWPARARDESQAQHLRRFGLTRAGKSTTSCRLSGILTCESVDSKFIDVSQMAAEFSIRSLLRPFTKSIFPLLTAGPSDGKFIQSISQPGDLREAVFTRLHHNSPPDNSEDTSSSEEKRNRSADFLPPAATASSLSVPSRTSLVKRNSKDGRRHSTSDDYASPMGAAPLAFLQRLAELQQLCDETTRWEQRRTVRRKSRKVSSIT